MLRKLCDQNITYLEQNFIQMNRYDIDFNNIPSKLPVYDYDTLSSGILKIVLTKSIGS
jgi:hypothetical protein